MSTNRTDLRVVGVAPRSEADRSSFLARYRSAITTLNPPPETEGVRLLVEDNHGVRYLQTPSTGDLERMDTQNGESMPDNLINLDQDPPRPGTAPVRMTEEQEARLEQAVDRSNGGPAPAYPSAFQGERTFTRNSLRNYLGPDASQQIRQQLRELQRSLPEGYTASQYYQALRAEIMASVAEAAAKGMGIKPEILAKLLHRLETSQFNPNQFSLPKNKEEWLDLLKTVLPEKYAKILRQMEAAEKFGKDFNEFLKNPTAAGAEGLLAQILRNPYLPKELQGLAEAYETYDKFKEQLEKFEKDPLNAVSDQLLDSIFNDWWQVNANDSALEQEAHKFLKSQLGTLADTLFANTNLNGATWKMDFSAVKQNYENLKKKIKEYFQGIEAPVSKATIPVARVSDPDTMANSIAPASPTNVLVNKLPAAYRTNLLLPAAKTIYQGVDKILVGGLEIVRNACMTNVPSKVVALSPDVFADGTLVGKPDAPEAKKKTTKKTTGTNGGVNSTETPPKATSTPGDSCEISKLMVKCEHGRFIESPNTSSISVNQNVLEVACEEGGETIELTAVFSKPMCPEHSKATFSLNQGVGDKNGSTANITVDSIANTSNYVALVYSDIHLLEPRIYEVKTNSCHGLGVGVILIKAFPKIEGSVFASIGFGEITVQSRPHSTPTQKESKFSIKCGGSIKVKGAVAIDATLDFSPDPKASQYIGLLKYIVENGLAFVRWVAQGEITLTLPQVEFNYTAGLVELDGDPRVRKSKLFSAAISCGIEGKIDILPFLLGLAGAAFKFIKFIKTLKNSLRMINKNEDGLDIHLWFSLGTTLSGGLKHEFDSVLNTNASDGFISLTISMGLEAEAHVMYETTIFGFKISAEAGLSLSGDAELTFTNSNLRNEGDRYLIDTDFEFSGLSAKFSAHLTMGGPFEVDEKFTNNWDELIKPEQFHRSGLPIWPL